MDSFCHRQTVSDDRLQRQGKNLGLEDLNQGWQQEVACHGYKLNS